MTGSLRRLGRALAVVIVLLAGLWAVPKVAAQQAEPGGVAAPAVETGAPERRGGEANLILPDLASVDVGGYASRSLLMVGMVVSALGILFGLVILNQLKNIGGPQVDARSLRADL